MRKIFLFGVCLFTITYSFSQTKTEFSFKEVWQIFSTPFSKVDSLIYQKGYTKKERGKSSTSFLKVGVPDPIEIVHTYYDSTVVSAVNLILNDKEILSLVEDIKNNSFLPTEPDDTLTRYNYKEPGISNFESVRYFICCTIINNFPGPGKYKVTFLWHNLMHHSVVVIKKGANPSMDPDAEAEFHAMKLEPFDDKSKTFTPINDNPVFRGGLRGMYIFLNSNVQYPEAALKDSVEASITVQYEINKNGKLVKAAVIKGAEAGHGLPEEAVRLFMSMPDWRPGRTMGELSSSSGKQVIVFKIRPARYL